MTRTVRHAYMFVVCTTGACKMHVNYGIMCAYYVPPLRVQKANATGHNILTTS